MTADKRLEAQWPDDSPHWQAAVAHLLRCDKTVEECESCKRIAEQVDRQP